MVEALKGLVSRSMLPTPKSSVQTSSLLHSDLQPPKSNQSNLHWTASNIFRPIFHLPFIANFSP